MCLSGGTLIDSIQLHTRQWDICCLDCNASLGVRAKGGSAWNGLIRLFEDANAIASAVKTWPKLWINLDEYGIRREGGNLCGGEWFLEHVGHKLAVLGDHGKTREDYRTFKLAETDHERAALYGRAQKLQQSRGLEWTQAYRIAEREQIVAKEPQP